MFLASTRFFQLPPGIKEILLETVRNFPTFFPFPGPKIPQKVLFSSFSNSELFFFITSPNSPITVASDAQGLYRGLPPQVRFFFFRPLFFFPIQGTFRPNYLLMEEGEPPQFLPSPCFFFLTTFSVLPFRALVT